MCPRDLAFRNVLDAIAFDTAARYKSTLRNMEMYVDESRHVKKKPGIGDTSTNAKACGH
jgi:hypothetical protein